MSEGDKFRTLMDICAHSLSQEEMLDETPFFYKFTSQDSPETHTPVSNTPIIMISPPDTPLQGQNNGLCCFSDACSHVQFGDFGVSAIEKTFETDLNKIDEVSRKRIHDRPVDKGSSRSKNADDIVQCKCTSSLTEASHAQFGDSRVSDIDNIYVKTNPENIPQDEVTRVDDGLIDKMPYGSKTLNDIEKLKDVCLSSRTPCLIEASSHVQFRDCRVSEINKPVEINPENISRLDVEVIHIDDVLAYKGTSGWEDTDDIDKLKHAGSDRSKHCSVKASSHVQFRNRKVSVINKPVEQESVKFQSNLEKSGEFENMVILTDDELVNGSSRFKEQIGFDIDKPNKHKLVTFQTNLEKITESEDTVKTIDEGSVHKSPSVSKNPDIDKFMNDCSVNQAIRPTRKRSRELPKTFNANKEACESKTMLTEKIGNILKMLSHGVNDAGLENISIFDIAKGKGVTFPEPRWWSSSGFRKG